MGPGERRSGGGVLLGPQRRAALYMSGGKVSALGIKEGRDGLHGRSGCSDSKRIHGGMC